MRTARSYSIVDHALLHGGYLARLSHAALALYLFLCVVGDREGKNWYGESSVMRILRFSQRELDLARLELIHARLIDYRRPYACVLTLTRPVGREQRAPDTIRDEVVTSRRERPSGSSSAAAFGDAGLRPLRGIIPEGLTALMASLEGR
jgi:hypothetical protein